MRNRGLVENWGGGVVEGVGNFQYRPINPVILFYSIDWSTRLHVSSFTNRAGLKQPVTTEWIKPRRPKLTFRENANNELMKASHVV